MCAIAGIRTVTLKISFNPDSQTVKNLFIFGVCFFDFFISIAGDLNSARIKFLYTKQQRPFWTFVNTINNSIVSLRLGPY
jgi:hypothetical protein